MAKYQYVFLSLVVTALIGVATAQKSQPRPSSAKSGSEPLTSATKPLTPKSAMPAHRKPATAGKPAIAGPRPVTSSSKATTELNHLERGQNAKNGGSKSSSTAPAKSASAKSTGTPASSGSGIDFKYQKPVAQKPATPGAHSQGPTPEVTKQN